MPRHLEAHRPFRQDGDVRAFVAAHPDAHTIDLSDCALTDPQVDELCESAPLDLEKLLLDNGRLSALAVERLWRAPFRLHELSLRGNRIEDAGWRAISESERARELVALDLADSWFESVPIAGFAGSRCLQSLWSLDWSGLWEGAVGPAETEALRRARWMLAIRRLGLARSVVNDGTMIRLAETPLFEGLLELCLRRCQLGWDDLETLSQAPSGHTLVDLDIRENDLGMNDDDECWAWLLRMKSLRALRWGVPRDLGSGLLFDHQWKSLLGDTSPRLRAFGACNLGVDPRRVAELVSFEWMRLDELDLSDNLLADEGLRLLVEAASLSLVRTLTLARCGLAAPSIATLIAAGARFVTLDLSGNLLASSTVRLLQSPAATKLETAALAGTGLTDADLQAVAKSTSLGALRSLDVSDNPITRVGIDALVQSNMLGSLERIRFSVPVTLTDSELLDLHDSSLARGIALRAIAPASVA